jgi:hypothetical protein
MKFEDCIPGRHLRQRTEDGRVCVRVLSRMLTTGRVQVERVVWTHGGWAARGEPVMADPADLS